MPDRTHRRAAALLLRWAAQIVSGEDPELLHGCTFPLRQLGLELDDDAARLASEALKVVEEQLCDTSV